MKTKFSLIIATVVLPWISEAVETNGYPIIDIHTHVFNAKYLPIQGIVESHHVPRLVAIGLKKAIVGGTHATDLSQKAEGKNRQRLAGLRLIDDGLLLSTLGLDDQQDVGKDLLRNSGVADLTVEERRALADYAGVTNTSFNINALMSDPDFSPLAPSIDDEILTRALLRAHPLQEEDGSRTGSGTDRDKNYLRFIRFLMNDEIKIVNTLEKEFPEVSIFVHHMMDMEMPYNDKPFFPLSDQIQRMRSLQEVFAGELLTFVAFDPFRRRDALDSVIHGLNQGAVGVKFYPPSGYRASSNEFPAKPTGLFAPVEQWESRYFGWSPNELDAVNEQLFAYCESNDVPLFTHCTSHGFEAFKGSGAMCNPSFWESVLQKHQKLRLCFGHAGGSDGWFDQSQWPTTNRFFSEQVYTLCTNYQNVFCEVGYWDEILGGDLAKIENFRKKFKSLLRAPAQPGGYAFADKIMYGSDWHMIMALNDRKEYLHKFRQMFQDQDLGQVFEHKFFAQNAARFLKLARLAESESLTKSQREYLKKILARL